MTSYQFPEVVERPKAEPKTAWLIPSGDLREPANTESWPIQKEFEELLTEAFAKVG